MRPHDIVIIGGGPAGLTAAIKAGTEGLSALVIERDRLGGRPVQSPLIENVPGFDLGVSGPCLFSRLVSQAAKFGSEFVIGESVIGLNRVTSGTPRIVVSTQGPRSGDLGHHEAYAVILAMGEVTPRLDALKPFEGRGVEYTCDAAQLDRHAGQHVVLVGGGNSCAQLALSIAETDAASVTIITRSPLMQTTSLYLRSRLARSRIKVIVGEVEKAYAQGRASYYVGSLLVARGETFKKQVKADHVYVYISGVPPTGWFGGSLDAHGYVLTGHDVPVEDWPLERHPFAQESSIPGVFVAGDVRAGATGGITVAFGEGTQAFQWIKREYLPSLNVIPAREEVTA